MPGHYERNVLRPNTEYVFRPRNKAEEARFEAFNRFDTDGDGVLSVAELRKMLTTIQASGKVLYKLPERELRRRLDAVDRDGDGVLSPEEFCALAASIEDAEPVDWPRVIGFAEFDADGNGYLTKREFGNFVRAKGNKALSPTEVTKLFQKYDTNDDGKLDLAEWTRLIEAGELDPPRQSRPHPFFARHGASGGSGAGPGPGSTFAGGGFDREIDEMFEEMLRRNAGGGSGGGPRPGPPFTFSSCSGARGGSQCGESGGMHDDGEASGIHQIFEQMARGFGNGKMM